MEDSFASRMDRLFADVASNDDQGGHSGGDEPELSGAAPRDAGLQPLDGGGPFPDETTTLAAIRETLLKSDKYLDDTSARLTLSGWAFGGDQAAAGPGFTPAGHSTLTVEPSGVNGDAATKLSGSPKHIQLPSASSSPTPPSLAAPAAPSMPSFCGRVAAGTSTPPSAAKIRISSPGGASSSAYGFARSTSAHGTGSPLASAGAGRTFEALSTDEQVIQLLNSLEKDMSPGIAQASEAGEPEPSRSLICTSPSSPTPGAAPASGRESPGRPASSRKAGITPGGSRPRRPAVSVRRFITGEAPYLRTAERARSPRRGSSTSPGASSSAPRGSPYSSPPVAGRRRRKAPVSSSPVADQVLATAAAGGRESKPNPTKLQAKVSAQELRIRGQIETIRALEESVKVKEVTIKALEAEKGRRSEAVRSAQAASSLASATSQRLSQETSKSAALMASRKRGEELSARCSDLEAQVKEMKKADARARERTNSLLSTIKAAEEAKEAAVKDALKRKKVALQAASTIKTLHKQVKALEKVQENNEELNQTVAKLQQDAVEGAALRKSNKEMKQTIEFLTSESARIAAAAQKSETQAQEAEQRVKELTLQNSRLHVRLGEAEESVRAANEDRARAERHAKVMESTCERLRGQLQDHTDRVRKEMSDKRWEKAKAKAAEASKLAAARQVPGSGDPARIRPQNWGAPLSHRDDFEAAEEQDLLGSGQHLLMASPSDASPVVVPSVGPTQAWAEAFEDEQAHGGSGTHAAAPAIINTTPRTTPPAAEGPSTEERWALKVGYDQPEGLSPLPRYDMAVLEAEEDPTKTPGVAELPPDESYGHDIQTSASKRLEELRCRYSLLKGKLGNF